MKSKIKQDRVKEIYEQNINNYSIEQKKLNKYIKILSFIRLFWFVLGVIVVFQLFKTDYINGIVGIILFCVVFFILIKFYHKYDVKKSFIAWLLKINNDEIKALTGNYEAFESGEEYIDTNHPFLFDLDIFGQGSMFNCINRTTTYYGKNILAGWFKTSLKSKNEIYKRQSAIKELSSKLDWRQNFLAIGYASEENKDDKIKIQNWLQTDNHFTKIRYLNFLRFFLPLIVITLLVLNIVGLASFSIVSLGIILQFGILGLYFKKINYIHELVTKQLELIKKISKIAECIENEDFKSPGLISKKGQLFEQNTKASKIISKLGNIMDKFDFRLNIPVSLVLNGLFLWDIHCVCELDRWKDKYKNKVPEWFDIIGDFDALTSLSGFLFNNPSYVFPLVDEKIIIDSSQLGHPLLKSKVRVDNNFKIERPGEIVIITGANMAGKSTFLRTVGVNLVLAMMGAPVCAKSFSFSIVELYSGMRTSDSLQKNESYFYAELIRLKNLIKKLEAGGKVFFILDEILKGTNSVDKLEGSKAFLKQVINLNGTGIVATHDLKIAEMQNSYSNNIRNMCFEIEIDDDKIFFDYLLNDGITKKMNASFLMKQMGIG